MGAYVNLGSFSGWDSIGSLPWICSEDGRERALDGHFLWFRTPILTPRPHNVLQQLAENGLLSLKLYKLVQI
jgi:hypothetical protein